MRPYLPNCVDLVLRFRVHFAFCVFELLNYWNGKQFMLFGSHDNGFFSLLYFGNVTRLSLDAQRYSMHKCKYLKATGNTQ